MKSLSINGITMPAGKTEAEAKAFAMQASVENPDMYVTLYGCFGIFCSIKKRMNVFEPSDSIFGVYWLNGKQKPFTKKQKVADSMATPTMN
jgi:hypothetical protein